MLKMTALGAKGGVRKDQLDIALRTSTSKQLLAKSGVGLGSTEYVVSKLTDSGLTSTEGCVQGSDVIRRHTVPAISNINGLCASDHVTEHQHH